MVPCLPLLPAGQNHQARARKASPHPDAHVHVDLVSPLPASEGCTYLISIIDCTTRWAEAVLLATTSAADCARVLFRGWIARFGVLQPSPLIGVHTSHQLCGLLFESSSTSSMCRPLPTIQRAMAWWSSSLRARCAAPDWIQHLPWVMLGIRATPHEDTDITPAQAVFGSALVLPGQIATDPETSLDNFMSQIKATLSRSENLSTRHNTAAAQVHPTELPAAPK